MEISELKSIINEIKISVYGLNSRMDSTEERISKLEDRPIEITQSEQQIENGLKKKKEHEMK